MKSQQHRRLGSRSVYISGCFLEVKALLFSSKVQRGFSAAAPHIGSLSARPADIDASCSPSLITVKLSLGPACVSAGGSAVLCGPALQLQPPRAGCSPAEAALLRERPKEGPPEADPHDDRRSLRPQWTHCERGELNWGIRAASQHCCFQ